MQIRRRGKKIEFLRSVYQPEKGRSTQITIGRQDYFLDRLEADLKEKMTNEEVIEAKEFFKEQKQKSQEVGNRVAVNSVASEIRRAAKALEAGQEVRDEDQAASIYQAMSELAKQLKRAGFPKSAVAAKKKTTEAG